MTGQRGPKRPGAMVRAVSWIALASGLLNGAAPALAALPKVPEGFKIRLVAAVPAVQYPCQVATAPDGSLFVAEDPMDQTGPANQPIDRILLFREGKGPVVFAEKLNAVFGMLWHEGSLYVMNMPNLTVFRDHDGDGKADERKDLFTNLGVPAGFPNGLNDHIVSGLKIGMDGRLYISVGDKGVPWATGPDGRVVTLRGGGILRCRPDGTELEIFSSGTRNHLEPNLDDRDRLFTYDNTDDGLGWWTRVTYHVDGGYYGYPFDYHTRKDRMLPRMAEYGGGSPCGGVFYGEDAWPEKYRGRLYWAEWGKRAVQSIRMAPDGATFKVADKIDFIEPGEVENFRPLDLALSHDGRTLYVADWSMGGWANKTEKLGRVYAVTYAGELAAPPPPRGRDAMSTAEQIRFLEHPSYRERRRAQAALVHRGSEALGPAIDALNAAKTGPLARRHLVWTIDAIAGGTPEGDGALVAALKSPVADVRAQAARALGLRVRTGAIGALADLLKDREPSVRLQAIIALGRIGPGQSVAELVPLVAAPDVYLAFAARKALRRIGDWPKIARGLDSKDANVRAGTMLTLEEISDDAAVEALARFAASAGRSSDERIQALRYLAEAHHKAPPWNGKWWGTQPARGKPAEKTIAWSGTRRVLDSVRDRLQGPSDPAPVRAAAAEAIVAMRDRDSLPMLRSRFSQETDETVRCAIARALGALGDKEALGLLTDALRDQKSSGRLLDATIEAVESIGGVRAAEALAELLKADKPLRPDRKARVIAALGRLKNPAAVPALLALLKGTAGGTRDSKFKIQDSKFKIQDSKFKIQDSKFKIQDSKSKIQDSKSNIQGSKSKVTDSKSSTDLAQGVEAKSRAAAIDALAAIVKARHGTARSEVVGPVRQAIDGADVEVRRRAIAAAAALHDRDAIPALLKAAQAPATRFEAALGLAALPDTRALPVYLNGLTEKSTDLRLASARAIVELDDRAIEGLDRLAERGELPSAAVSELRAIFAKPKPIVDWHTVGPFPIDEEPGAKLALDRPIDLKATFPGAGKRTVHWRAVRADASNGMIDLGRLYGHDDDRAAYAYAEFSSPSARTATMMVGSDDTLIVWLNGREVYRFDDRRGFAPEQARFDVKLNEGMNRVLVHCGNRGGPWQCSVAVAPKDDYAFLNSHSKVSASAEFNVEAYRAFALKAKGDARHGRALFHDLKGLACARCHAVDKPGQTGVGPELSSVASKYPRDELIASVLEPSAKISSGYEPTILALEDGQVLTGIVHNETDKALDLQDADSKIHHIDKDQIEARKRSEVSIMPEGLAKGLSPQDFADLIAYLQTLKNPEGTGR